jgi:phosphoribosyl 1,2-cyclic phosphodiesterase
MSLRVQVLSSGSSGNAALYSSGKTHVLVDCGLSARALVHALRRAGVEPDGLSGVFLTHEHTDHTQGLRVFLKRRKIPLFAAPQCHESQALCHLEVCQREPLEGGREVRLGSLTLTPFLVPHDSACCYGFSVEASGVKAVQATDLGQPTPLVRERLRGAHCILLEFNHDLDRLMTGSYPMHIKIRVRGSLGHLSNEQAAQLLAEAVNGETRAIYLMHLSKENNLPQLALLAAREALGGKAVPMEVAKHMAPAEPWEG